MKRGNIKQHSDSQVSEVFTVSSDFLCVILELHPQFQSPKL